MANPFLRTAHDLALQNRLAVNVQKQSAELYEPYAHAVVQQREHPPLAQKIYSTITSALATAKEEKQQKQEYVSKQLYRRKELAEKALMEGEDKNVLMVNRTSPAVGTSYDLAIPSFDMLQRKKRSMSLETDATFGPREDLTSKRFTPDSFKKLSGNKFRELAAAYKLDNSKTIAVLKPQLRRELEAAGNYIK